jgi:hypothetical protein
MEALTFEKWLSKEFDTDQLKDMHEHGADTGYNGMCYYADIDKLFNAFEDEIWEVLDDVTYDSEESVLEFLDRANGVTSFQDFRAKAVYRAAEAIAYRLTVAAKEKAGADE